jgi:hypothetical protein
MKMVATNNTKAVIDPALFPQSSGPSDSSPNIWMMVSSLLMLAIAGNMLRRRYILFLATSLTTYFLTSTLPSALAHELNTMDKNTSKTGFDPALLGASSSSSPNTWMLTSALLALAIASSMWQRRCVVFLASLSNLPTTFAQSTNTFIVTPWIIIQKEVDPTLIRHAASTDDLSKWLFGLLVLFLVLTDISSRRNPWLYRLALLIELPVALAQELNATKFTEHKGVDPNAFHGGSISHGFDKWMLLIPLLGFVVVGNVKIRLLIGVYIACLGSLLPIALAQETNTSAITEHKGAGPIISGAATVANLAPWAFIAFLLSLFLLGHIKPGLFLTRPYMSHGVAAQAHEKKQDSADASATSTSTSTLITVALFVTWGAVWGLLFMQIRNFMGVV